MVWPRNQGPAWPRNQGPPFPIKPSPGGGGDPYSDLRPVGGNPRSETNLRTGAYIWTISAGGTAEYYVTLATGANPTVVSPNSVVINNAVAIEGTALGSLTAGQWKYGNADTLGFNTLYVRVAGDVDPDTLANGYIRMIA